MGKIPVLVIVLLLLGLYGCKTNVISEDKTKKCAKEREQFSKVYIEDYPENCCKGLEEWESGMDTSISIGDECYGTGAMAGSPVGICINCGNGICEDIENPCNCHEDCAGGKNSRHLNVEEFCDSSPGKRLMEECSFGMDLPICELC